MWSKGNLINITKINNQPAHKRAQYVWQITGSIFRRKGEYDADVCIKCKWSQHFIQKNLHAPTIWFMSKIIFKMKIIDVAKAHQNAQKQTNKPRKHEKAFLLMYFPNKEHIVGFQITMNVTMNFLPFTGLVFYHLPQISIITS